MSGWSWGESLLRAPKGEAEPESKDTTPTREELSQALANSEGNVAKVADHFGKDRKQIYRWAERLGVELTQFRPKDGDA